MVWAGLKSNDLQLGPQCDEVGNGQELDWMASAHSSNFNHCCRCKVSGLYWLHFWTGQGGWDTLATFKSLRETIQWQKILTVSLCEESCRISPSVPDMVSVNHGLLKFNAIFFFLSRIKKKSYILFCRRKQLKLCQVRTNQHPLLTKTYPVYFILATSPGSVFRACAA